MKSLLHLIIFSLLSPAYIYAQQSFTVSGYVLDVRSGENLPNANVQIVGTEKSVSTNTYGYYSITVKEGKASLKASYVGFESKTIDLTITGNLKLNFEMGVRNVLEKGIVVKGNKRKDENVKTTEVGVHQLSVESVKKLPVILGEVDVLKTIQLLPGVKNGGEGSSGFYVRGGGPDQNLILLDDAVVYNTGHLFGFFSVFNGDAVKNITLIKGGMPAEYGGRLSSVLDVNMKEGNNKEFKLEGGIGLIASRLSLQGPIIKNKASFILSGRRTYATELLKLVQPNNERLKNFGYYFYDFNAKINYKLGSNDRLYASGYFGDDVFKFSNRENTFKARIPWGNRTVTVRWNHLFNDKLFMNTTAVYNRYDFQFAGAQQAFNVKLTSGIRDWNLKTDLDYFAKNGHKIKFGAATIYHTFQPSTLSGSNDSTELTPVNPVLKYALESSAYISDDFDLNKWCRINAGLRYSSFLHLGGYKLYQRQNGINIDSITYQSGEVVKAYGGLEPRLNARFSLDATSSIKTSITKSYQYIHLVTNNGSTLPTDLWVPSTLLVQPQKAWQYSGGYFKNFLNNMLETSVEVYYKDMYNQLEYKEGYTPNNNNDPEYEFVQGKGWAYGAEFFINKTKGQWTGWIGYTLSYTKREFEKLNSGNVYFAKYDRRHDLSIVNTYERNKAWTFSSVFVFSSGNRVTLPTNLFTIDRLLISQYDVLNNQVLPPYHRLDLGAVYTPQHKKPRRYSSSWAFSIYNVYNNFNPYIIYLDTGGTLTNGIDLKLKQISIFPIIPSITWNFKF
jgi:CarboxypepD_reg-like domain/TonB-dependent Receptor Plug Domain